MKWGRLREAGQKITDEVQSLKRLSNGMIHRGSGNGCLKHKNKDGLWNSMFYYPSAAVASSARNTLPAFWKKTSSVSQCIVTCPPVPDWNFHFFFQLSYTDLVFWEVSAHRKLRTTLLHTYKISTIEGQIPEPLLPSLIL